MNETKQQSINHLVRFATAARACSQWFRGACCSDFVVHVAVRHEIPHGHPRVRSDSILGWNLFLQPNPVVSPSKSWNLRWVRSICVQKCVVWPFEEKCSCWFARSLQTNYKFAMTINYVVRRESGAILPRFRPTCNMCEPQWQFVFSQWFYFRVG
jgi:hypothetical protein